MADPLIDYQIALDEQQENQFRVPNEEDVNTWVVAALKVLSQDGEQQLAVRIVGEPEIASLNKKFRNKPYSTNVLSFEAAIPDDVPVPLLGDVVICAPVVCREADAQNKSYTEHYAHMVVHGLLHLLGYDHIDEQDAETMEALEVKVLAKLGFSNPYEESTRQ